MLFLNYVAYALSFLSVFIVIKNRRLQLDRQDVERQKTK